MSVDAINAPAVLSREQLRTFHLTGLAPDENLSRASLRPTILAQFKGLPRVEASYPICVHPDGSAQPFRDLVDGLENAGNITSAFRAVMNGRSIMLLQEAAEAAIATLEDCPPTEIVRLRKLLRTGSFLIAFHPDSLVVLHAAALAEARSSRRNNFWEGVRLTAARLLELLLLDEAHAPGAVSALSVGASMGSGSAGYFDTALLAKALQRPANPLRRMDRERRSRCESTLATLKEALHDAAIQPAFWLFHSGIFGATTPPPFVAEFRGEARWAFDSFAATLQFCDTRLERLTNLLRALRVARLEIDSAFDPVVHEEMLARFDWQAATPDELNALPPVIVIETASSLGQASLSSFGKLLRSGRPVQILIVREGLEAQDLQEFTPDFGYLSIAHRESFVLQSSMAQPSHLLAGLKVMAKTPRPAVAVVSTPGREDSERESWLEDCLMVLSRTLPLYTYNPDAGPRWAERFQLHRHAETAIPADLTAAHAAAVSQRLQQQFRTVPPSAWNSDQMELAQYLEAYTDRPPLAIPYLWVETENGSPERALLTRDLANFCVDRRRAWALFEELAGMGQPQPGPDVNARQEGARDALQRVIAMLGD
jgi:hypothetical protein